MTACSTRLGDSDGKGGRSGSLWEFLDGVRTPRRKEVSAKG